jgi:hypothetical protein
MPDTNKYEGQVKLFIYYIILFFLWHKLSKLTDFFVYHTF